MWRSAAVDVGLLLVALIAAGLFIAFRSVRRRRAEAELAQIRARELNLLRELRSQLAVLREARDPAVLRSALNRRREILADLPEHYVVGERLMDRQVEQFESLRARVAAAAAALWLERFGDAYGSDFRALELEHAIDSRRNDVDRDPLRDRLIQFLRAALLDTANGRTPLDWPAGPPRLWVTVPGHRAEHRFPRE